MAEPTAKETLRRLKELNRQKDEFIKLAEGSAKKEVWNAAVNAHAKAREVASEIERIHCAAELSGLTDPEARFKAAAQLAYMEGSYVAASNLEVKAHEVRKAREDAERLRAEAEAAKAAASTTLDAATAAAVDALKGLPEAVRAAIKLQL